MLVLCDFDGTVTQQDTMQYLCNRYARDLHSETSRQLMAGEMTLGEVLTREIAAIRAAAPDVIDVVVNEVPFRAGFAQFVDAIQASDATFVILSSGFRDLIEPMLHAAGVTGVEIIANSVDFSATDGGIDWDQGPPCDTCGQSCKRYTVDTLRAATPDDGQITYIGDGFSDRCGSLATDRIIATGDLATWLDDQGRSYDRFDDFHDVRRLLGL